MSVYDEFSAKVEEIQKRAKSQGQSLSNAEAMTEANRRFPGLYEKARESAPPLERPAPERPVMKVSSSQDTLIALAEARIAKGEPRLSAYEAVCKQFPDVYALAREGK